MGEVAKFKPSIEMHEKSIEVLFEQMVKYGKPRLHCLDGLEWVCVCEIFVTGKGIDFKISSDYKCTTPLNAVQQCYDRMMEALNSIDKRITS
jgi:hypothetical protein